MSSDNWTNRPDTRAVDGRSAVKCRGHRTGQRGQSLSRLARVAPLTTSDSFSSRRMNGRKKEKALEWKNPFHQALTELWRNEARIEWKERRKASRKGGWKEEDEYYFIFLFRVYASDDCMFALSMYMYI